MFWKDFITSGNDEFFFPKKKSVAIEHVLLYRTSVHRWWLLRSSSNVLHLRTFAGLAGSESALNEALTPVRT